MPSHSAKQHRFMEAIAHSPSFAKKAGVPQSVGKEFAAADKGKTFKKGGEMKESKAMIKKEVAFMKAKGAPKSMIKHEEAEAKGYRRGGRIKRYDEGGISEGPNKNIDDDTRARALAWAARGGKDEEAAPAARPAATRARPAAPRRPAAQPTETRVTTVETERAPQADDGGEKMETGPYRGRAMSYKGRQSPERQQQNAENVASAAKVAASMLPLGRVASAIRGGIGLMSRAMDRRDALQQATPRVGEMMERAGERLAEQGARGARELGTEGLSLEEAARLSPEALRNRRMIAEVPVGTTRRNPILEEAQRRAITGGRGEVNPFEGMKHSSEMSTEELMDRARMIGGGYKRGGNVKETIGPMDMHEDVEGGEHAQHMRFGEHSEQHRGHTRGMNLGDSGPSVGIEGGGKMKASHIKHIMTMAAGGLTAPQIAKIMSGMHQPARKPAMRGMAPGMPPGMAQGGQTKRMAAGGFNPQPIGRGGGFNPQPIGRGGGINPQVPPTPPVPSLPPHPSLLPDIQAPMMPHQPFGMARGGQTKRMAVGGISAQPTAMSQMQQRPQQNMMNMRAQVPPAGQGRQFAMQQAQHPQMGGINPHPQMGGMQPTGRGGFNPRPPIGGPQPTGRGGGINPNPQIQNLRPGNAAVDPTSIYYQGSTSGGLNPPQINNNNHTINGIPYEFLPAVQAPDVVGGTNLNDGWTEPGGLPLMGPSGDIVTGWGPNHEPIYSQQDRLGRQIKATGPSNVPQPTGSGGGTNPQPQINNPTTPVNPPAPFPTVSPPAPFPTVSPPAPLPFIPPGYPGGPPLATAPQYAAGGVTKKLPTAKQMGAMALAKGGRVKETMGPRSMKEDVEHGSNRHLKHGESAVQKKGHTKGKNLGDSGKTVGIERGPKHFAKGGHVKSIDGIARRGHTKVKYR